MYKQWDLKTYVAHQSGTTMFLNEKKPITIDKYHSGELGRRKLQFETVLRQNGTCSLLFYINRLTQHDNVRPATTVQDEFNGRTCAS